MEYLAIGCWVAGISITTLVALSGVYLRRAGHGAVVPAAADLAIWLQFAGLALPFVFVTWWAGVVGLIAVFGPQLLPPTALALRRSTAAVAANFWVPVAIALQGVAIYAAVHSHIQWMFRW